MLVLSSALATRGGRWSPLHSEEFLPDFSKCCYVMQSDLIWDTLYLHTSPFSGLWKIQMVALLENVIDNTAELQTNLKTPKKMIKTTAVDDSIQL